MTSVVARGNREKTYLSTEGDKGMVVEGEEERWSNGVTKWGLIYAKIAGDITRSTFLHLVDEMAKPSLEHVVRGALLCPIFGGKAGMDYIIDCITAVCSTEGANRKLLFWADFDPRDRIAHNSLSSARIELKHS
ncbi:hypothetical protein DFH09DRAFT_1103820 [Mycena vulgaris]|nr:hypothetical protein DFH09DRAFT_1103820 [Mycena vulgaris]